MLKSTKRFILHTENLNSQGFRMLTDGAVMDDFMNNPVLLFNHIRPKGNKKNQILPLGYWEDIELKDGVISATPVFDEKDEFAKAIYDKVEAGVIKMCSMGAEPLETSNDPSLLLAGQKLETVTKWRAKEGSLCDIGANPDSLAVALYNDNNMITLNESGIETLPVTIKSTMKPTKTKVQLADDAAAKKLADDAAAKKLADDAAAEAELADDPTDDKDAIIEDLKKQLAEALAKLEAAAGGTQLAEEDPAKALADEPTKEMKLAHTAHKMGKIRLNEVLGTIELAKVDYPGTVAMLKAKKAEPTIKKQLEGAKEQEEGRVIELSKKGWDELFKETGSIEFLKLNAPDVYKAKFKSKFGKEPKNL